MIDCLISSRDERASSAVPVRLLRSTDCDAWLESQDPRVRSWARTQGFTASRGSVIPFPGLDGRVQEVVVGLGADPNDEPGDPFGGPNVLAAACSSVPPGDYRLLEETLPEGEWAFDGALAWAKETYRFERYRTVRSGANDRPRFVIPVGVDEGGLRAHCASVFLVRDLINTSARDMGPHELTVEAKMLGMQFDATVCVVVGDALFKYGCPLIHAVGRASARQPRLIEMRWGDPSHPKVTIVGKGVCFDTGGLDLKPSNAMRLMKKDMGGAAHALGLARLVMALGLPVRLRVLIVAVDNVVGEKSMLPGDAVKSGKGLFVEIGNTDAEGRLILADALNLACEEDPELVIDLATLTGAARAALGPDLPALFANDEELARVMCEEGLKTRDPVWRLPLWKGYRSFNESAVADITNEPQGGFAGAIAAALFLQTFVTEATRWAHVDLYAWRPSKRPGHPEGAAAQALRPCLAAIRQVAEGWRKETRAG